ncbi:MULTISPECIES: hypothetical protein [unclassified Janthinobacterium]|uniref:hypothetical protein n=1 Tax=unclassified Janthinobacterium TaxID=2610881 RepID=UPI000C1654F1|nr:MULTISPECIES: hypothetical protein [unclassified Janthinobacterium]MDN2717877.1 hypothetical protein [Janthinobacterium sp. SUN120]MDO8041230.1 hypothetical protein [Janthinobacterium sp. SUN137]PIF09145.1 hypothetical protein CLU94_1128 [Janthinobacterium sp. 13]
MSVPIYKVKAVHLAIDKSLPPHLHVSAIGEVSSGGWQAVPLAPRVYLKPPQDGIQDLDFEATPPRGSEPVIQVILPIVAGAVLALPDWLKGVRVHARTNAVVTLLTDEACLHQVAAINHD